MHNETKSDLTVEQEFAIASFCTQVDRMSLEQAKDTLKLLYEAYVVQKVTYLELIKDAWFTKEA